MVEMNIGAQCGPDIQDYAQIMSRQCHYHVELPLVPTSVIPYNLNESH